MNSLSKIVAGGLATYRLSLMITLEHGPGGIFSQVRYGILQKVHKHYPDAFYSVEEGIHCFWCVSFWMGALVASTIASRKRDIPLTALALSGMAIALYEMMEEEGDS